MYEQFFGLTERPFDLTPNPKYLFLTPSHREALSNLDYGISARTGVTVLIGEAGTGKTTLIRATLNSREAEKTLAIYLNNPTLTRQEFLEFLAHEFELPPGTAASKTTLLQHLEHALVKLRAADVTPALIIDEAQSLPHELLEEIRLLANIETTTEKLLPIVLAGQPELAERLNHPSLRQLKQRVGLRCQLTPLSLRETGAYITARVSVAGGAASTLFTREAVSLIHERSEGIPRVVSVICHNSLISAFALSRRPVTAEIVREVCQDFDLAHTATTATAASARPSPVPSPAVRPSGTKAHVVDVIRQAARSGGGSDRDVREMFGGVPKSRRWFSIF
jgi:general secretion pathway protein A